MWGIAREWGTLSAFSVFRDEERHQSWKSEIRKSSFHGEVRNGGLPYGEHAER